MTDETTTLATGLMQAALCNTATMPEAVAALMLAAGQIMHATLGDARTIATLRSIVDQAEAAHVARHGRQPGEAVQ